MISETLKSWSDAKLTIELVPSSCWYSNVRSNVSASVWNRLKQITSKNAGHCCEVCGGRGARWPVECHEIWHYDDETGTQQLCGLVALCPACHEVKHIGLARTRGRGEQALRHLERVNGWTREQAELYIEASFIIWERRSRRAWKLDLGWLESVGVPPLEQTKPFPPGTCARK